MKAAEDWKPCAVCWPAWRKSCNRPGGCLIAPQCQWSKKP